MPHLIATIFSIGLMGMMLYSLVDYSNPRMAVYQNVASQFEEGLKSIDSSWNAYRIDNQVFGWVCHTHETMDGQYEDCVRELIDPGYLDAVEGWGTSLYPTYGFHPRLPADGTLSYASVDGGYYFCISGEYTQVHAQGIKRTLRDFPDSQLVVNTICGSELSADIEALNPPDIKLTYWVKR